MLIQRQKRTYLNIKDGQVVRKTDEGEQYYSSVTGVVEGIELVMREWKGVEVPCWYLNMKDGAECYSIGFGYESSVFKGIVLSISSDEGLKGIEEGRSFEIRPYFLNGYNKACVYMDGRKLSWCSTMPQVKEVHVGEQTIKDTSERMKYIKERVNAIREAVGEDELGEPKNCAKKPQKSTTRQKSEGGYSSLFEELTGRKDAFPKGKNRTGASLSLSSLSGRQTDKPTR